MRDEHHTGELVHLAGVAHRALREPQRGAVLVAPGRGRGEGPVRTPVELADLHPYDAHRLPRFTAVAYTLAPPRNDAGVTRVAPTMRHSPKSGGAVEDRRCQPVRSFGAAEEEANT